MGHLHARVAGTALIALLVGCGKPNYTAEDTLHSAANSQEPSTSVKAWRSGEYWDCTKWKNEMLSEYHRLMDSGKFWEASNEVRLCAVKSNNDELLARLAEAEIKSRVTAAQDKVSPLADRVREAEALKRDYPAEWDKYKSEFAPLVVRFEKEDAKLRAEAAQAIKEAQRHEAARRKKEGVSIGMTPEDVIASSWGKPRTVNRTTNAYGVREQWVYGGGNYLYFRNGRLETIQN